MNFRPRYSLLTLLLLTAIVAGGLKLWRGPHRVAIGETLNTHEQALVARGVAIGFSKAEWQYEYDYRRGWQEQQIMSVTSFPTKVQYLITLSTPDYYPGRKYLYSEAQYHKFRLDTLVPSSIDRVHCWIRWCLLPLIESIAGHMPAASQFIATFRIRHGRQTKAGKSFRAQNY
jgi:hypothetical protein